MNSHQSQNKLGENAGRDEARSLAPEWLTSSLDLLGQKDTVADNQEIASKKNFVSRVKTEVRSQESERVLSDLPGSLAQQLQRALPGSVPGGTSKYFESFLSSLKNRIDENLRPDVVSSALGVELDRAREDKFAELPTNYFGSFLKSVHERIENDEAIPMWMCSALRGPATFGIAKKSYFAEQQDAILDTLGAGPVKRRLTLIRSSKFRYSTVAASAACLAVFSFIFNLERSPIESMSLSSLHQSYGVESVESVLEIQESLVGSNITAQLIRAEFVTEKDDIVDIELVEPASVLLTDDANTATSNN